jgi:hypothetical protein
MDWNKIALGGVSLFPLFGYLKDLKGFYLNKLRDWFIVFSTIFSLFIYYFLQWNFDKLQGFSFYISPWAAIAAALVALFAYIGLMMAAKKQFPKYFAARKFLVIAAALALYMTMVVGLTYAFNFLKESRNYKIVRGIVYVENLKLSNRGSILVDYGTEHDPPRFLRKSGKFLLIVKNERYEKINSVLFNLVQDGKSYCWTGLKNDISVDIFLRIKLSPEKGGM